MNIKIEVQDLKQEGFVKCPRCWHYHHCTENFDNLCDDCCGHNSGIRGFIGVIEEDIPRMYALGYTHRENPMDKKREDSFYPLTKL